MISLCMICWNEAAIIAETLSSAADAFDELCLVRAVGSATPDGTIEIARAWCIENGKVFRWAEFLNADPTRAGVDDFGAARQQSFDLATGEWQLWLDCDDYLDPINCARIREAAKVCEHDVIFCHYLVETNGGEIMRERLIRRGTARWRGTVHETCVAIGTSVNCPQIRVFHREHGAKHESSAQRNATLLTAAVADSSRNWFYLHAELKMLGKTQEAIRAAKVALAAMGDWEHEQRYVILLNLAELEPETRETTLLAALGTQPHRREALAYLCQAALARGCGSDATSWFRLMDALPLPSPIPWTHQGIWYGWARHLLRIRILKLTGQTEQAELELQKHCEDPEFAAAWRQYEPGFSLAPSDGERVGERGPASTI